MKIESIERFVNGEFQVYEELFNLYRDRNADDGRYTIMELNDFALEDQAPKKRKFLITLIDELEENGYMKISNPIRLYDNLLVGRKRSASTKNENRHVVNINGFGDELIEENNEEYEAFASLLNFNPNIILYGLQVQAKHMLLKRLLIVLKRNTIGVMAVIRKLIQRIVLNQSPFTNLILMKNL